MIFAFLDIIELGLQGSEGNDDDTVVYGEIVTVIATTYIPDVMLFGFYAAEGSQNSIRVYYYSAEVPTSQTYLGYIDHTVLIGGAPNEITGTFELLPYTAGGTAFSIQVMLGVWINDPPEWGTIVCSFISISVGGPEPTGGAPEGFFQYLHNDGSPLPVTLSSFTAQFTNGKPTLYWTTQSETNNMGWNLYRSISQNLGQGIIVNIGGLIPGQETTSEPTDYVYVDQNGVVENTTYWYWLESVDNGGETEMFGPISLTIPLGGGNSGTPEVPDVYGLYQNYPNPFNPSTEIRFALDESSYVILTIYNAKGQKIRTLYEGNVPADIFESVLWDGRDNSGKQVASGIYLYELQTNKETFTRKMILTK